MTASYLEIFSKVRFLFWSFNIHSLIQQVFPEYFLCTEHQTVWAAETCLTQALPTRSAQALRKVWHCCTRWCATQEECSEWVQCFKQRETPPGWRWTRPASWRMWWHVSSHSLFIFVAIQTPPKQPKNPTHEQWRDKLWDPPNGVLYSHYTVHRIGSNVEKTYIWTLSEREKNTKVYI